MKKLTPCLFVMIILFIINAESMAVTLQITADFSPSMNNPEKNTFTNTTPQSGYCISHPAECEANNIASIASGLIVSLSTDGIKQDAPPRESVYFGMPGAWREVRVMNSTTGSFHVLKFRVNSFSAMYYFPNGSPYGGDWHGGSFHYAPSPCTSSGMSYASNSWYSFVWKIPTSNDACYKIAAKDYIGGPSKIDEISFGYDLQAPNPLLMDSGNYVGKLSLTVGPGGDIDFGDSLTANDNNLEIEFNLSVNHELQLTTSPDSQNVSLQPCAPDRICSTDEGVANWERWMVTRIPPSLTGRSNFSLTSSGRFSVYLACEQQSGTDCALKSDTTSQQVPVQALLTLADNVVDAATGSSVTKRRLKVGRDINQNVFDTKSYTINGKGHIYFMVDKKNVETMLKTRPDVYRGAVTVIFDANLF